jgi:hypothetical protein
MATGCFAPHPAVANPPVRNVAIRSSHNDRRSPFTSLRVRLGSGTVKHAVAARRTSCQYRLVVRRSDLTRRVIGTNQATEVEIVFANGRRRLLLVRADEADELAARGRKTQGPKWRFVRGVASLGRPLAKWLLVSLIGVLVVQALTKQWSDRQKELELKRSLASDLGTSSYRAFADARSIAFLRATGHLRERRLSVLTDWITDEGRIDGIFRSYLVPKAKHPATLQWIHFRDAFYSYLRVVCCEKSPQRNEQLDSVQEFLKARGFKDSLPPKMNSEWHRLRCGPGCTGYADAYDWLGRQVLRGAPFRTIEASHPKGFSSGFNDFVHDAVPGF